MHQSYETPAGKAGARGDLLGGWSQEASKPNTEQTQFADLRRAALALSGGAGRAMSAVPVRLGRLQCSSLAVILGSGRAELSANETAEPTGFDCLSIQPRISKLCRQGLGSLTVSVGAIPVAIPERSGSLSNAPLPFRKCQTCEVRGQSAAKPKRARVISHNPCQACEMPAICHFGRSDAAFETSTNARHGEVSKVRSKAKGRGGTRNYADRESSSLTAAQVSNLIAATAHASAIGLPFTRMITIHWVSAGVALNEMAKATGHFTDLLTKTLARHGGTAAWLWVHESGEKKGGHCHLLVHVPAELVPIVVGLQKRWLRQITGRSYKTKVIKSRPIGFLLGLEKSNPDLHAINLRAALAYVLKGASPEAASQFGLERLEPGGRVIGKRCGTSQNIGAKARTAAFSKPLRRA